MAQVSKQLRVNEQNGRECAGAIYVFLKGQYRRCTLKAEGNSSAIRFYEVASLLVGLVNLPRLFPLYALSDLGTACKADVFYMWMLQQADYRNLY